MARQSACAYIDQTPLVLTCAFQCYFAKYKNKNENSQKSSISTVSETTRQQPRLKNLPEILGQTFSCKIERERHFQTSDCKMNIFLSCSTFSIQVCIRYICTLYISIRRSKEHFKTSFSIWGEKSEWIYQISKQVLDPQLSSQICHPSSICQKWLFWRLEKLTEQ